MSHKECMKSVNLLKLQTLTTLLAKKWLCARTVQQLLDSYSL